jgi:hypothetical protein
MGVIAQIQALEQLAVATTPSERAPQRRRFLYERKGDNLKARSNSVIST